MRLQQLLALLFFCLSLSSGAQAQTTYRWADQDGQIHYSDQPPPPNIRNAQEKKLGSPNTIAVGGPDYPTRMAAQGSPVTLYSSGNCVAECQLARDFLRQNKIPFGEKPIKTAEDVTAFKRDTGSQELLVPTLLVGTQVQQGYEEASWRKLLAGAGYPVDSSTRPSAR